MEELQPNVQIIPPNVKQWGGTPVLTAHGCALIECFTGKTYTYRAVNLKTGTSVYLCHKPKPLAETEFEAMAERIQICGAADSPDLHVEAKLGKTIPKERLAQILEYIFASLLPKHGYSFREEQAMLADHIFDVLCRRAISLSEAGVGIGKTHAYLIAAALVKRGRANDFWLKGKYPSMAYAVTMPVVVSTSSIALQKAIVNDYIPEISKILIKEGVISKSLTCVIRKGKEHYVCDKRLASYFHKDAKENEKKLLAPLIDGKHSIDLGEMNFIKPYVKKRINVAGSCGKHCSLRNSCRYNCYLKCAQSSKLDGFDFQVTNHNYILADIMRRTKGQSPLIPNYQAIIIDEAHKFLQAARQIYGVELSRQTFTFLVNTIKGLVFQPGQSTAMIRKDTDKLQGQSTRLFNILRENMPDIELEDETERFKTEIDDKVEKHLKNIREIIDRLTNELSIRQVMQKYVGQYACVLWELAIVREHIVLFEKHEDLIYWLEKPENKVNNDLLFCAIPKKLGEMLNLDLWSNGIPIVLTSGTLSASGDFSHIKLGMGLDKIPQRLLLETSKPSPFNYNENAMLYISETAPFPNNRDMHYINAITDETEQLIMASHGHAAVLFTSYRVMGQVFDELEKRGVPFPIFKLDKGNINTIEQFRKSGNGVLFASGSMWEGIDLPGDILSLLVIVKLPFAVPDPISEYEQILYGGIDKYKNRVIVPEMLVKLKQGFGRLIRSETDTGVVAILDSRVRKSGQYRERVLRSLPECHVTSSISTVSDFISGKKQPDYFE